MRHCGPRRSSIASTPAASSITTPSGNLGSMHTINFYPNLVPIQEMSDWFEHWATKGVKPSSPANTARPSPGTGPCTAAGTRASGSSGQRRGAVGVLQRRMELAVPRRPGLSDQRGGEGEPPLGGQAVPGRQGLESLGYPNPIGYPIGLRRPVPGRVAMYLTDNLAGLPHLGVCRRNSPWEHGHFWKLRARASTQRRKELQGRLGEPAAAGLQPDYLDRALRSGWNWPSSDRIGFPPSPRRPCCATTCRCWPTSAASRPTSPARTTTSCPAKRSRSNSSSSTTRRQTVACECQLVVGPSAGRRRQQDGQPWRRASRSAFRFASICPPDCRPASTNLRPTRQVQQRRDAEGHRSPSTCCRRPPAAKPAAKIALFDPKGETGKLLDSLGVKCQRVEAGADLSGYDVLIVGKAALTVDGPGPDVSRRARRPEGDRVRADLRRAGEAVRLPRRGVRPAATSSSGCPIIRCWPGLDAENLRDWRGEATILPPRLKYELRPIHGRRRSSGATFR